MLSPSPYFINEVTEVEMLIISLKVSLWESNLALVQYQILWPRKLEFQKGGLPWWVYDCPPPGSWDKNVLDGHNWWGIVRGITVSPQYSDSFVSDYKQCLRLEQNWWGSMFHSHGYGICCLAGMPKRDSEMVWKIPKQNFRTCITSVAKETTRISTSYSKSSSNL